MTPRPRALASAFGSDRLLASHPLAPLTTFGIGGPADWFLAVATTDEFVAAVRAANEDGLPVTVLGGGSNVLVADGGVRGLVLRPRTAVIARLEAGAVTADAGVTINGLVRWTILERLGGLEAWAGTPGTVGGAICGNAHWGGHNISERTLEARLLGRDGTVSAVAAADLGFAYDTSRLQRSGEYLLSATFQLDPGQDPERLRAIARASLLHRKRTQPLRLPSAGCIFQNPTPGRDVVPDGIPWSAGALIDRAGLKGHRVGGALVSPVHANFIVNDGGATARDVRTLIDRCRQAVDEQFGVRLREEIVCLGGDGET